MLFSRVVRITEKVFVLLRDVDLLYGTVWEIACHKAMNAQCDNRDAKQRILFKRHCTIFARLFNNYSDQNRNELIFGGWKNGWKLLFELSTKIDFGPLRLFFHSYLMLAYGV